MSVIEAQNAIIAHLKSLPNRPAIAYPNGPVVKVLPRIVVSIPSASQRTVTLCGETQADAEVIARVETQGGEFVTASNEIVGAIVDRFPFGDIGGGVTILDRPRPATAFRADGVYYVPVLIRGRFYFS